jgi:hypothetical protein
MSRRKSGFLCCAALAAMAVAAVAAPREMSVSVESADVRAAPGALGRVVGSLPYTEVVEVVEESGTWCRITAKGGSVTGWLPAKSLAQGRLKLEAGRDVTGGASASETALAGKGFTEQVEREYRKKNPKVDFAWVERMLGFKVRQNDIVAFLKQGGVDPAKGGAR